MTTAATTTRARTKPATTGQRRAGAGWAGTVCDRVGGSVGGGAGGDGGGGGGGGAVARSGPIVVGGAGARGASAVRAASTSSRHVAKRSCGSFCRARVTTWATASGRSGRTV